MAIGFKEVSISAILMGIVAIGIPLIYLILKCNEGKLENDQVFNARFGVLFKGLKLKSGITY